MGRSDPHVFNFYVNVLNKKNVYDSIGFFGFSKPNQFSDWFVAKNKCYYDIELDNWNINHFPYDVREKFDLIVCTRVAYFSKDPKMMLTQFKNFLKPDGKILVDWGLGDHWRFQDFAIGWKHHGYQEFAYREKNYLWSSYHSKNLKSKKNYALFEHFCKRFGYDYVESAIDKEVDVIITDKDVRDIGYNIEEEQCLFLWPESPQLYTCLLLSNKL